MQAERQLAEKVLDDLRRLFTDSCFQEQDAKHSLLSWAYDEEASSIDRFVDMLTHLQEICEQQREEIPGITVLVQRTGLLSKSSHMNSSIHQLYLVPEENGIWCTPGAADVISHFVQFSEMEGFLKIEAFNRDGIDVTGGVDLFGPDDIRDCLVTHILDFDRGETDEVPVLVGPAGSGKRLLIGEVLNLIEGKTSSQPWLTVEADRELGAPLSFLLKHFDRRILSKIEEYLDRRDLLRWGEMKGFLNSPPHSWADSDAALCFLMYAKAYRKFMEEALLPPLVILHGYDEVPPELRSFLMKHLMTERDPFILLVSMRNEPGEVFFPSWKRFDMNEWTENLGKDRDMMISTPYELYYPHNILESMDSHTERVLGVLDKVYDDTLTVYYHCAVLDGIFEKKTLMKILNRGGIRETDAEQCLSQLTSLGLVTGRNPCFAVDPGICSHVRDRFSLDFKKLHANIEESLFAHLEGLELFRLIRVAKVISLSRKGWDGVYRAFVVRILSDFEVSLGPFVEQICELAGDYMPQMKAVLRMIAALRDGDLDSAGLHFRAVFPEDGLERGDGPVFSDWQLTLLTYMKGEYLWRKRSPGDEALKLIKKSLLDVQEMDFPELESHAVILLGKIMLTNGRLTEAAEYFRQARQKTFDTSLTAVACESTALTALTHFLTGDYSLANSHAAASEQKARSSGRRLWERYNMMLRGRIEFELGRYREAGGIFQNLMTHERLYFDGGKHDYFHAWTARAFMYQGYVEKAKEILSLLPETAETLFFLAESQVLNRNLKEAMGYVEKALEIMEEEATDIMPIELLPGDGFEPYENFALKIPGVYSTVRQILYALRGFLLHELGRHDASREAFQKLFEQEKISRQDPYRHLYYYFFTVTLPAFGEKEELNMVTYLSKSFQSLQRIAGKISEPADRRSYITMNYWNSRLYNLSRQHKLI